MKHPIGSYKYVEGGIIDNVTGRPVAGVGLLWTLSRNDPHPDYFEAYLGDSAGLCLAWAGAVCRSEPARASMPPVSAGAGFNYNIDYSKGATYDAPSYRRT